MIEYLAGLPKKIRENLIEVCYDDACHLKKYCENEKRANVNEVTKFMAGVGKHVDKFHFPNHVDSWCHQNCNPQDVRHLDGVNTPICEQLFSAINKFTNAKSMNEANFFIFFIYVFDLHNLNIENKLSYIANPKSELRYEHIGMEKINSVEEVLVQKDNEIADIGELLERMVVRDTEKQPDKSNDSECEGFKCEVCGTEYKRLGNLKLHLKKKHGQSGIQDSQIEALIKCNICDIRYDEVKYLNRHIKIHHSTIICTWCNVECSDKENHDEHIKTHLTCDVCRQTFDKQHKLNRHMKTHIQTA